MPTSTKPCQEPAASAPRPGLPPTYRHLYTLLHTLRALSSQQDHICTLLAEIQRSGKLSAPVRRELTELLHNLPTVSLESEVQAVFATLDR